jgi:hypothetical protein
MLSAASSIAALQVDLIASSLGLLRLVDEIAFQLLEEKCPLQERIRRLRCLTRMTGRIQGTIIRAIDVYIWCFGGKEQSRFKLWPNGSDVSVHVRQLRKADLKSIRY